MHGIKRNAGGSEEEKIKQAAIIAKKIENYQTLLETLKKRRQEKDFSDETLKFTEELLKVNVDCYSMWNYRREILLQKFTQQDEEIKLLNKELTFIEQSIMKNAKSYWCWNQREWVTTRLQSYNICDWKREISLCSKFLKYDARNFHCWNYRRYVAAKSGISDNAELEYTMTLIEENFSNYSAWHQRSKLLPLIFTEKEEFYNAISEELEIVQNAFYTMPNDSSAWFYHRWLVNQNPAKEVLEGELKKLKELLDILESKDEKKWPKLTIVFLLRHLGNRETEVGEILDELILLDPARTKFYQHCKKV